VTGPILVFLEHHGDELTKGGLGVLGKAASLSDDVAGVVLGSGVKDAAAKAGAFGATKVYVCDDPALAAPLPQQRVDALAALVEGTGAGAVLFASSVLAADVAAGLAARLEAGLNWDLAGLAVKDGRLVGTRPALGDSVLVEVSWKGGPCLALVRSGTFDPQPGGGSASVEEFSVSFRDFSTAARMLDQAHEEGRILEECRARGLGGTKVVRLPHFVGDLDGTRKIIQKVAEYWKLREKLQEFERDEETRRKGS